MSNRQVRCGDARPGFRRFPFAGVLSAIGAVVLAGAGVASLYSTQPSKAALSTSAAAAKPSHVNDAREKDRGRGHHHQSSSWHDHGKGVQLRLLSSPAKYVSGGDARIAVIAAPGLHNKLQWFLNGRRVEIALESNGHRLEAVVTGFTEGRNVLEVYVKHSALRDSLEITNYPITGPMFSGPQQHPFVCTTTQGGVGAAAARRYRVATWYGCSTHRECRSAIAATVRSTHSSLSLSHDEQRVEAVALRREPPGGHVDSDALGWANGRLRRAS